MPRPCRTSRAMRSAAVTSKATSRVAALLGVVVLGQTLGPVQLAGFALALASIVAGQLSRATTPKALAQTGLVSGAAG